MENELVTITGFDGQTKTVKGIFYLFNSKYYFMYTEGEMDGEDYVKLYSIQVGKEVVNNEGAPVETGNMIGVETSDPEEWKKVQESITQIVQDKKNNTKDSKIQYLPTNMLSNLKIMSENKFKLLKQIVVDNFKFDLLPSNEPISSPVESENLQLNTTINNQQETEEEVIIDYRTKFFEEQDKNNKLEETIKLLEEKIENIKKLIE